MEHLKKLYASLSRGQRFGIFGSIALVLAVVGLLRWQAAGDWQPLYGSLSPEDAGAVVQRLKESGVEYKLTDNGTTVLVRSDAVDESRLDMATAGLPKTGRIGFELFDRTNLGVTEFAEHINHQRALEGELARSVMSLSEVELARVHLTFARDSLFTERREPAKASVLLRLRPGMDLAPRNVVAISHLVSAAVEGLEPRAVSIVDMNGTLLSRPNRNSSQEFAQGSEQFVEYQKAIENSLVEKINTTLDPLLGPNRFRAEVSVECDFSSVEQSEESFDPSQSVMVSSHVTEETAAARNSSAGMPGTASTLPRPRTSDATGAGAPSRRTENTTFQTSRTVRRTVTPRGVVKKLSASVLLDHSLRTEGEGEQQTRVLEAPSAEKVQAIHDLVAAAIGLDPQRGDQLTVQSLPFEMTLQLQQEDLTATDSGTVPVSELRILERLQQDPILLGVSAGAVLLLLGAVFWAVTRMRKRKTAQEVKGPQALAAGQHADGQSLPQGANPALQSAAGNALASAGAAAPQLLGARHESLAQQARTVVSSDAELSAGIIQGWMVEEGQP